MACHNSLNVYEYEKILRYKEGPTGTLYLVKWKEYSDKHNSWEPQENFVPEDIEEFMERQNKNLVEKITKSEAKLFEKKIEQQSKLMALEQQAKDREQRKLRRAMKTT